MPKKSNEKPRREMTKRQLSHWQRESRIQRFAMLGGIIVIVAVLILVGSGLYVNRFKPLHEVVIKVGDTEYNMDYYIDMLAYYGLMQGTDYIPYMADYAVQAIEQNKIMVDAAANLNPPITVSDDEVNEVIQERKLSASDNRKDIIRAELLVNKLRSAISDGKIPDLSVPQSAEQRAVLAMFLESQGQADEVIARLKKGEKFQDIAAELSLETNSKTKNGDFGWVPKDILSITMGDSVLADKAFSGDIKLNEPLVFADPERTMAAGYWLLKVTETKEENGVQKVHLYAMVLESQEKANSIKAQLDAGADFVELAKANSQHYNVDTNSGDLGFVAKDTLSDAVDAVIFPEDAAKALEINKVSAPVKDETQSTTGGVWLSQVTGMEADKTIETDHRNTLITEKINTWVGEKWTESQEQEKVQTLLTDEQKMYAIEKALTR